MKVLVTGAAGFVGKNLCESLKNIRDGKDKSRQDLAIDQVYEYDISTDPSLLNSYCSDCDFVFNLAGVNRPENPEDFMKGNFGFASLLLESLKRNNNTCPVMLSSSIQATLLGRYAGSDEPEIWHTGSHRFLSKRASHTGTQCLPLISGDGQGAWRL